MNNKTSLTLASAVIAEAKAMVQRSVKESTGAHDRLCKAESLLSECLASNEEEERIAECLSCGPRGVLTVKDAREIFKSPTYGHLVHCATCDMYGPRSVVRHKAIQHWNELREGKKS